MFLTGNHLPDLVLQSIEDVLNQIRIKVIGRGAQGRIVAHVNVLPQKFPNVTIQQGSFDESIGLDRNATPVPFPPFSMTIVNPYSANL